MQLFKRLLLSLFPSWLNEQNINPAALFVSFITSKEFFSVVNRKVVENYRLNMFDISLDSLEFKIWFGNQPNIAQKDIETYYGYCSSANINGYRFMNPTNIGHGISLISGILTQKIFKKYDWKYFSHFMFTTYLLSFVFASQIKTFPYTTDKENFNRLVDLIIAFYEIVYRQTWQAYNHGTLMKIKKDIATQTDCIFMLLRSYQNIQNMFTVKKWQEDDFIKWLFQDQYKDESNKSLINEYSKTFNYLRFQNTFSLVEKKLLAFILPSDILLRHILTDTDPFYVIELIIEPIYNKKTITKHIEKMRQEENHCIENFFDYITNYTLYKEKYFEWIKKYISKTLHTNSNADEQDEIDEFMSRIWDIEQVSINNIPEKIKKESKIMEKLVNFYISFIAAQRIARGENWYIRICKPNITKNILFKEPIQNNKQYSLHQYWSLLYSYSKNTFFYKYAANNIRSGKEKFYLPFRNTIKRVESNMYLIEQFNQTFISMILQDINAKDIKLYVSNNEIIKTFKKFFAKKIKKYIDIKNKDTFIEQIYKPVDKQLESINIYKAIHKDLNKNDIHCIKESLYTIDFWLAHTIVQKIYHKNIQLSKNYNDINIIGILGNLRETITWFMLYMHYLNEYSKNKNTEILYQLYCSDILHIHEEYIPQITETIKESIIEYRDILNKRIALDDNKKFLVIMENNRSRFHKTNKDKDITQSIVGEDIIRLRSCIKHIAYYNKRFIIPQPIKK